VESTNGGNISSGVIMGRSFESIRQSAKDVPARWQKESRTLKKVDLIYRQWLAPSTSSKMDP